MIVKNSTLSLIQKIVLAVVMESMVMVFAHCTSWGDTMVDNWVFDHHGEINHGKFNGEWIFSDLTYLSAGQTVADTSAQDLVANWYMIHFLMCFSVMDFPCSYELPMMLKMNSICATWSTLWCIMVQRTWFIDEKFGRK